MKKKQYENPATTVVGVQQMQMLMTSGERQSYGTANVQTWGDDDGAGVKAHGNYFDWDND